ncbi:MAG TPA: CoA-binding protein, partial [Firmicutes bacterium]|nr:CoA-binding protein [Bacillota bacterium]
AESHTRSVAGSDQVFDAACRKAGLHRADTLHELYDFSKALALLPRPRGSRLLVVTSSGGSGILATDAAQRSGLRVDPLPAEAAQHLRQGLPSQCVIGNPLDLTGDTDAERYYRAVTLAMEHDLADLVLLVFGDPIPGAAEVAAQLKDKTGLPVAACYLGGGEDEGPETLALHRAGIPVYVTPERAARALAARAGLTWHRSTG